MTEEVVTRRRDPLLDPPIKKGLFGLPPHVLAIIGPTSTGEGLAVKKYTEEKHVPVIMTVGGDAVIAGGKFGPYDWTFKAPQRTATAVAKIYDYLKGKNISKIAVLSSKDAFGQDGLTELKDNAAKYGIEIIAEETFDPKGTDFSAQAFKLQAAKPQAAVVWTIGPAGSIAAKNFAALPGERPLLVQCHGQPGPTYLELAGEAAGGTVMPGTKLMAPESLPDEDPQADILSFGAFDILQCAKAHRDRGRGITIIERVGGVGASFGRGVAQHLRTVEGFGNGQHARALYGARVSVKN